MSIINWNPFTELEDIQSDINKLFDDSLFRKRKAKTSELSFWQPVIDVIENKNEFKIRAEIPGIVKEDIKININNDVLTIKGEKKQETEEKEANYHRTERIYGLFQRQLALPQNVDANKISAKFKDGVLEVVIPKGEEAKPKEIKVA